MKGLVMFSNEELHKLELSIKLSIEYFDSEIETIEEFDGGASGNQECRAEYKKLLEKVRKM